jgi:hypothetical protein
MANNKNVIEDTLIQISNLEESLNRNAQGILASTMKEEINNLVKESLKEQDEVDDEEVDVEETDTDNFDEMGDEEVEDIEGDVNFEEEPMAMTPPMDSDEYDDDVVDMTQASDAELIKVFKAMDSDDGIIVQKDDNMLSIKDNETDSEYIVQLSESELDEFEFEDEFDFEDDDDDDGFNLDDFLESEDFEELDMRDIDMDIKDKGSLNKDPKRHIFKRKHKEFREEMEDITMDNGQKLARPTETTENIYELELDEMMHSFEDEDEDFGGVSIVDEELYEGDYMEDFDPEMEEGDYMEDFDPEMEEIMESKKSRKPKGVGMGKASKFKYSKKPNQEGGFKTVKRKVNKTMGTGKPKYEWKEEVNMYDESKSPKSPKSKKNGEMKEASRVIANNRKVKRGIMAGPSQLRKESINKEVNLLREKNEEYRKALNLFRNKLNEVAIFNSNLAYATRLFTEHSTTKQEKINILRRFDNVETLKESKTLYKVIKNELGSEKPMENTITESIQRTVERAPATGSAVNLIESKTYENPQFLRMKDLMGKIK